MFFKPNSEYKNQYMLIYSKPLRKFKILSSLLTQWRKNIYVEIVSVWTGRKTNYLPSLSISWSSVYKLPVSLVHIYLVSLCLCFIRIFEYKSGEYMMYLYVLYMYVVFVVWTIRNTKNTWNIWKILELCGISKKIFLFVLFEFVLSLQIGIQTFFCYHLF